MTLRQASELAWIARQRRWWSRIGQAGVVQIRRIRPDEHDALGRLTVEAYRTIDEDDPVVLEGGYADELADVAHRAAVADVLVAVDDDGTLLGGLTLVPPGPNPMAEHSVEGAASIRMLAVAPSARRRGIARLLTEAALELARSHGAPEVVLHSSTRMLAAHQLYGGMGFTRAPELDWNPIPGVDLLGFRLRLATA